MTTTLLTDGEVAAALLTLPGWEAEGGALTRTRRMGDFPAAIAFVVRVAFLAEQSAHHPDITVAYDRVTLRLTTHDAGGITARDVALARAVGALA